MKNERYQGSAYFSAKAESERAQLSAKSQVMQGISIHGSLNEQLSALYAPSNPRLSTNNATASEVEAVLRRNKIRRVK